MISIIKRDNIYQLAGYKSRKVPTFPREFSKLCFLNSDFLMSRSAMQSLPILSTGIIVSLKKKPHVEPSFSR